MSAAVTRAAVVAETMTWLDTPYHDYGRIKGVGVDCPGLPIGVARAVGAVEPTFDVQGYPRRPTGDSLLQACAQYMTPISQAEMAAGDVVACIADEHPGHLGILFDYRPGVLGIIHATDRAGQDRVVMHRLVFGKHMRFAAAFRLPGVA